MNIGVIFAGGSGKRMHTKDIPKQFLEVAGKPIIIYTLEVFEQCADIDAVVVACLENYIGHLKEMIARYGLQKIQSIVPGGKTGQESIYNGLCAAEKITGEDDAVVLIHDGVRPLITKELISENIKAVFEKGNAVTVAPAVETVFRYSADTGMVLQILDRNDCYVAKAPQAFFLKDILKAHRRALQENRSFIDSASMMYEYGHSLYTVESNQDNIKVTTPVDYYMLQVFMNEKIHSKDTVIEEEGI